MAGILSECVDILLNLLNNSEQLSDTKDIFNNISNYFQEEHTRPELDLALSVLLNEHDSLIYFVKRAVTQSQFKHVVENSLEIVQSLINQHVDKMGQYFITVKEVCMSCALSENTSADCKDTAYQIVVALIENKGLLPPDAVLGVHRLLNTLKRELSTTKKVPTVQKRLYQLCGVLAEHFPVEVSSYSRQLMKQLIYELVQQTHHTNDVQMQVITGCLLGLTGMLVNFTQDYQENPQNCKDIYKCVKKLVENDEVRQRVAHRAALGLLSRHMQQFWAFVYNDYAWWLTRLQRWTLKSGDDRKAGLLALEIFYVEISNYLATSDTDKDREVLRHFIKHYTNIFKSSTAPQHDVTLAIKGFGKLSRACQRMMSQEDVVFMFTLILQRVQQIILKSEDDTGKTMNNLSDYLESLSDISRELEVLTEEHLLPLKQMCVLTVEHYPQVSSNFQYTVVNAVMVTIFNISLAPGYNIVRFVEDIVYQIVIRMCGHPLIQDAELQKEIENKKNVVTYKSYLPFWKDLFDIQSALKVNRPGVTAEIRQNLLVQLYDALIITLMKLIRRLDLSTKIKTTDQGESLGGHCDPRLALEANSPNDINVFCNLVDLYNDLLTIHHCEHMARWLPELSCTVISHSIKFPLISGFYKLLSAILQAADSIEYFTCSMSNREDKEQVLQHIKKFIIDLLVQLHQYKGDLQMSCLQVITSAPVQIVQLIIHLQVPDMFGLDQLSKALQIVFQVGYSYLALAHRGMDALERWHSQLPADIVKPLFNRILPYFDPFLQSTDSVGSCVDSSDATAVPKAQRLRQKLEIVDTELSRLQNRILDLLSRLDTPTCLSILHTKNSAVKWCSEEILSLDVPFADITPTIFIDSLAPRVMELALASSDRRTRCLACDVFHSLITIYLGNSTIWVATKRKAVKSFLKKVMPSLLQLGCNTDSYVQQLFRPLVLQIAHYYSSKMMLTSPQTNVFVEVVFDGLTHETDTAVRDFSALCLKEFVKWSIKQLSVEELRNYPFNIENIVKRINAYCLHPSIYKRLGAALAFNNLYMEIREETSIVDMFWLNILYHFVQSLAMYDYKDSHQIVFALDHVKRVIVERHDIFNRTSSSRQVPPGLRGGLLKDIVEWLLGLCSSKHEHCRHSCMNLVSDLAPCVQGCTHLKDFINGEEEIVRICEGGGNRRSTFLVQPESANMASLLLWLRNLLAALDFYTWLKRKGVPFTILHTNSSILSLRYFVSEITLSPVSEVLQKLQGTSLGNYGFSINDENVFTLLKCSVIVHLFEFVVATDKTNIKLTTLWDQSFWRLVGWSLLRPSAVGFDWSNQPLVNRLGDVVLPLLTTLRNQLSETQFREFTAVLESLLEIDCSTVLSELKQILTVGGSMTTKTTEIIQGLSTLHKCGHFSNLIEAKGWIGEGIVRAVFVAVTDSNGSYAVLEPPKLVYADSLLKLAYELGLKVEVTLSCVLDSSQLEGGCLTKGQRFYSLFLSSVTHHMLSYPDECIDALLNPMGDHSVEIMLNLLRCCQYPSKEYHGKSDKVVTNIVIQWDQLISWASDSLSRKHAVLNIVKRISATYKEQVGCFSSVVPIKSWLLNQMSLHHETTLTLFKAEVLLLLPCVVSQGVDTEDTHLRGALDFLCSEFPVSCSELPETSLADVVKIFKQLLYGLQRTGSPVILRAIVCALAHDKKHPCRDDIHNAISKTMKRVSEEKQLALIELAYSEYNAYGDADKRLGILHVFLLPLIQSANYDVVLNFFVSRISNIISLCEVNRKTMEMCNGWEATQQLISNIGACYLIEVMFSSLDESDLLTQSKPLTVASGVKQEEKALMKDVIKKMHAVLTNVEYPKLSSTEFKELFRLYICSVYSALISCIMNCVTEDKLEKCMYTYVFMLTKKIKNASVWEMIVPLEKTFTFPVLYNELPKRRKHLVEIKQKSHMENKNQDFTHTIQYLQTQTLYNSTLADDIREFDFTAYSVRDINELASASGKSTRNTIFRMEVELDTGSSDVESLCNHECMPILCATIQYLIKLRVPSSEEQTDGKQVPPEWMRCLATRLLNSQYVNVKIFILHIIVNCQEYFKPYAHLWLSPILEVITRDRCLGNGINAMIHEIVVMMASWSSHAIPDSSERETHYASEFLEFLVKNTHHERKDVRVYNLQIVRVIVELWKKCLQLPYQLLYNVISPSGEGSVVTGIQLTATMLANGLLPFTSTGKSSFYDALLVNLSKEDCSVYHPCAESIGHILRLLCEQGGGCLKEEDELFYNSVCNKLKTDLVGGSKGGPMKEKKQIMCIHAIQKNYPPIVNVFTPALLSWAPRIPFMFRVMILEALTTYLDFDVQNEGFKLLVEAGLLKFINGRDNETLKAALQLVNKLICQLKENELKILLPEIFKVSNHSDKQCRALVYCILAWFHDAYYRKDVNEELIHCVSESRKILIGGLADPESELQEKMYKFWSENNRLSNKTHERVIDILTTLYAPETEDIYIYNAAYFLLNVISTSHGFSKKIFLAPLSNCKFDDYKIMTSWRVQHATHVPLFTQTLSNQLSDSFGSVSDAVFKIRATQHSRAFQPTIVTEKSEHSSSFIDLIEPSLKSSFLFNSGSSVVQGRKHGSNRYPTEETSSADDNTFRKPYFPIPRRKFVSDKERISKKYAAINVRRADERKRLEAERVKKREAQVSTSRNYRYGDLPDIEITFKDIIGPLQELSKRDAVVAKQVFVLVFKAIKEEINDICTSVSSAIVDILNTTKHCTPTLIGTLLEIIILADTTVDETRLSEVSRNSKQLSLGALLMENKIIKASEGLHPPPTKKIKTSKQSDSWVHLAEIYKNIGEVDVVQGIFEDKINSDYQHLIKTAVQYESQQLWKDAQETYKIVTNSLQSVLHEDFVYQAYYKCSAYLSEWIPLNEAVKAEARNNLDNMWKNSWYVDNLLPWYFMSEIHCILSGKHERGPFLSEVDKWLNDAKKADFIKTRFGEQLCIVYLLKNEIQYCRLASENNLKNFVHDWSQLNVYAEKLKIQKLEQLQTMMEIHHYVSVPPVLTNESLKSLSQYWTSSSPTNSDSILNWLTRSLYRNFFVDQLKTRNSCIQQDLSSLSKAEVNNQLSLVNCALTQKNFYVARRYLGNIRKKDLGVEQSIWILNYSKAFLLRGQMAYREDPLKNTMSDCASAWEKLGPLIKDAKSMAPSLQLLVYQHMAHISNTISSLLLNRTMSEIREIEPGTLRVLHEIIGNTNVSSDKLHDHLYEKAVSSLKQAVECAVFNMETNMNNPKLSQNAASAYLELAKLCLQKVSLPNESVLIESLLRAMSYGSHEARQMFPCLLQLDSIETCNLQLFIDESHKVPEWMFLSWVKQLLSTLDTRKCTAVAPTLYHLAEAYPVALQFPFQLSLELYKNIHNSNKAVVNELQLLLQCDGVTTAFLQALTCLCQPKLLLEYHVKKLYQAIDHGKEEVSVAYRLLIQESFISDIGECIKGCAFDSIKKYKTDIDKAIEQLKGPMPNINKAKQELKEILQILSKVSHCESTEIEAYSPWLKKFGQESFGHIEIPGQYTGKCRPNSQYHVTISKFKEKDIQWDLGIPMAAEEIKQLARKHEDRLHQYVGAGVLQLLDNWKLVVQALRTNVKVMSSVRQPIRLTILGNDAKEYKFLVKFGEDLRQDERIQQLFSLMNQILSTNPGTASRHLYIDTYCVIPLNTRLGMIEWIGKTKPLRLFMLDSTSLISMSDAAKKDYINWLSAAAHHKSERPDNIHISTLTHYSREETVAAFRRRQHILPHDLLRKAVFKMSSSLESYMYLRSQMLTSHAVMCVCHWLLGIGDRHLNNTLVSMQTGRLLGIDFGCAFGTAIGLSVPELIPFRMTPCIVDLAAPMYLAGILQETMVHVLQTLHQNHMVLSATMQVFIEEPTVNWLEAVQNKSKEQNINGSEDESGYQWYAKHKIAEVESKLQGAHPCKIMEDDLMLSVHKNYLYIIKLKQLLWRNDGESKRMEMITKEHLTAREQVECLLDQATDEHILGKGYIGLELWI